MVLSQDFSTSAHFEAHNFFFFFFAILVALILFNLIYLFFTFLYFYFLYNFKKLLSGASLVAQSLRIRLPMQGTPVRSLVWEDPTCHGATKPVCCNY